MTTRKLVLNTKAKTFHFSTHSVPLGREGEWRNTNKAVNISNVAHIEDVKILFSGAFYNIFCFSKIEDIPMLAFRSR